MREFPPLEHALYLGRASGNRELLARSPGFADEWLPLADQLCAGFGERPSGIACPAAVFAQPFGRGHVAVVQVADQGSPADLEFHVVAVPVDTYRQLGGDPFHVAEHCPPPWGARSELTPLPCPTPLPLQRSAAEVRKVLQTPDSAALLGGAQILLDGGRLVLRRDAPATGLLRGLWTLLPDAQRRELWPASFAFGNSLGFHVLVVPHLEPAQYPNYLSEEAAADYPEGHYEHALQRAAEHNDQATLDALFARRSYREIRNVGLVLLVVALFIPMLFRIFSKPEGLAPFDLPAAGEFKPLEQGQRNELTRELNELAREIDASGMPRSIDVAALTLSAAIPGAPLGVFAEPGLLWPPAASAEYLIHAVDVKLGTPDPKHRPGRDLFHAGPAERQLRALLWKHAIVEYNDLDLEPRELVRLLREKVKSEKNRD